MYGDRKRTPIPIPEREAKAQGAGPVITYTLSPEELEEYRRKTGYSKKEEKTMVEKLENQLTKEGYLKLRLGGKGRTEIMKKHFRHSGEFYKALEEWGIKNKKKEERELERLRGSIAAVDTPAEQPKDTPIDKIDLNDPDIRTTTYIPKQEVVKPETLSLAEQIERLIKQRSREFGATEKIKQWAKDRGLDSADPAKQMLKLGEEYGELCQGMAIGNQEQIIDSIGDIYVVLTVLSLQLGLDIEACIDQAYNEIKDRKGRIVNGVFMKDIDTTA